MPQRIYDETQQLDQLLYYRECDGLVDQVDNLRQRLQDVLCGDTRVETIEHLRNAIDLFASAVERQKKRAATNQ